MARLPYIIPYDPDFLDGGFRVDLPRPACQGKLLESGRVFDYIHFSLVMHQDRKMALYTAHNIDVSQRQSVPRTGWDLEPTHRSLPPNWARGVCQQPVGPRPLSPACGRRLGNQTRG